MLATRKLIILCSMILAGAFLVIVTGCDREAKHKILTFFFEGVPPLDGEKAGETGTTTIDESLQPAVEKKPVGTKLKQRRSVTHAPVGDCESNRCHIGGMNSGQRELVEPMPDLCYSCHTNYHTCGDSLHGPVAVGECVFCHDPHRSKYVHLQKAPQPELCYQCHVPEEIKLVADHQEMRDTICTNCHDPHVSSMENLLKPVVRDEENPNTVNLSN